MPDNRVDSILLEIGATTDKADGGIDKVTKALTSMKKITEGIDIEKFKRVVDAMNGFSGMGDDLKNAGSGMRSIASSIKSLSDIDTAKLREIATTVKEVSAALGNLGSNNKISIKIDSEGAIRRKIQPSERRTRQRTSTEGATVAADAQAAMRSASDAADRLAQAENRLAIAGRNAAAGEAVLSDSINQTDTNSANHHIQELVDQINKYKATINDMENGKVMIDTSQYENAVNGLRQAREQFDRFKENVTHIPKSMDDVASSISAIGNAAKQCGLETFSSVLSNVAAILPAIETGGMAANAGFQSMAVGLEAVQSAIPVIGIILTIITALVNAVRDATNAFKNGFSKIVSVVKSAASKIRQGISGIIAKFKEFNKKIKETLGISDKSFSTFSKKMKSLLRLGTFMLLRKAFTYLFKYIGDGFNNLVLYSEAFGTKFHSSVSRLWSDIKWLGNSLATAFEPVINYIVPALDRLISKLVTATRALAQFFSALTGKGVYTKAIKLNDNYASSLNKASKAADTLTAGIDELNILQENSGGDGGSTAPEDSFITEDISASMKDFAQKVKDAWKLGDFTDIGKELGDKLAESLANIPWDVIRENARKLGKSLATLINGFIQGEFDGKSVSWWIGHTLAEAVNTAFEFLYGFVHNFNFADFGRAIGDLVIGSLDTLDWNLIRNTVYDLANGIKDLFNSIFGNTEMWEKLGTAISNGINTVLKGIWILVDGFDSAAFGQSMGKFFTNAIAMIDFSLIGKTLSKGIMKAFDSLYNFAVTFDFDTLAKNISSGINNFFNGLHWKDYIAIGPNGQTEFKAGITTAFATLCGKIGKWLADIIRETDFEVAGEALGNAVTTIFVGIKKFFDQIDPIELGNKIADFINGAFDTFNAMDAVHTINTIIQWVSDVFHTAMRKIKWDEIVSDIKTLLLGINWKDVFSLCFEAIAKVWIFKNIFKQEAIWIIGSQLVAGFFEGIINALADVGAWLKAHFVDPIVNGVKALFGIHSPSTVFMEIGQMIVAGLLQGLQGAWQTISAFFVQAWETVKTTISTALIEVNEIAVSGWNFIKTTFSDAWTAITSGVSNAWQTISTTFSEAWSNVKTKTSEAWESIKENFSQSLQNIKNGVDEAWNSIKTHFSNSWEHIKSNTQEAWEHIKNTFTSSWDSIQNSIRNAWENIKSVFANSLENIRNGVASAWSTIKTTFSNSLETVKASVTNGWNHIKDTFQNSLEKIKSHVSDGLSNVKEIFRSTLEAIKNKAQSGMEAVKEHFATKLSNIKDLVSESWNNIKSKFDNGMEKAHSAVQSGWTKIKGSFHDGIEKIKAAITGSDWMSFGSNIVNGIWKGISNGWEWLKNGVKNLATSLYDAARGALGIHSPSKKFSEIGRYIVEGLNVGIDGNKRSSISTISSWADSLTSVPMSLSTKFKVDDSQFQNYQNNYGNDFTNEAIVQRVTREVSTTGAVQATLNSGGGLKDAIKDALDELGITSEVSDISRNTKIQAEKKEKTTVQIGSRTVNDAVIAQQNANGFVFVN